MLAQVGAPYTLYIIYVSIGFFSPSLHFFFFFTVFPK